MSGLGRVQKALLAELRERSPADTMTLTRAAYGAEPGAPLSGAQRAATRRALAQLARLGLIVLWNRKPNSIAVWMPIERVRAESVGLSNLTVSFDG